MSLNVEYDNKAIRNVFELIVNLELRLKVGITLESSIIFNKNVTVTRLNELCILDMDTILFGIMKYLKNYRSSMLNQFQVVQNNPQPKALFFTCMDSRMLPTRFTQTNIGDMFIVRNAGNVVPNYAHFGDEINTNEPAALELSCVINDVRHIIVCGHSDCKAINLLYQLQDEKLASKENRRLSPLKSWLCTHAISSLRKYQQFKLMKFKEPLIFQAEHPMRTFVAYIDPDNQFSLEDKLSQIHVLEQLQNIASYNFLKRRLESFQLHIHALWFDIYTGDIYYFSRRTKKFVLIDHVHFQELVEEILQFYV